MKLGGIEISKKALRLHLKVFKAKGMAANTSIALLAPLLLFLISLAVIHHAESDDQMVQLFDFQINPCSHLKLLINPCENLQTCLTKV